jgi:hypothetical protein
MKRYRLRTLIIVLALGPPLLAGMWIAFQADWRPAPLPATFSTQLGARY